MTRPLVEDIALAIASSSKLAHQLAVACGAVAVQAQVGLRLGQLRVELEPPGFGYNGSYDVLLYHEGRPFPDTAKAMSDGLVSLGDRPYPDRVVPAGGLGANHDLVRRKQLYFYAELDPKLATARVASDSATVCSGRWSRTTPAR